MIKKKKKKVGRPKKTLDDLPKDWKEKTLEMAREGASEVEIRVEALDCISAETFYRLKEDHKEFLETIKQAKQLCEAWWLRIGRKRLVQEHQGSKLSYTGWFMNMKNRFGWKDKHDHTSDDKAFKGPVIYIPEEKKYDDE